MNTNLPRVFRRARDAVDDERPVMVESSAIEGGSVNLVLSFGRGFWHRLEAFLKQRQLKTSEGVGLLLEYGAPETDTARVLADSERFAVGGRYSSLTFKLYECFQENREITVGLGLHLSDNRFLKKKLAGLRGEEAVPRDEWDVWDKTTLDRYRDRYLFVK